MIERNILPSVLQGLSRQAAVVLLGPWQVGKTTLALQVAETQPSVYLDLESPSDRKKLSDPELYLESHKDKLVILDEMHRFPELFEILRGLIDQGDDGRGTEPAVFYSWVRPRWSSCGNPGNRLPAASLILSCHP